MTVHIYTADEFKSLTGRSNLTRIFKTKGGLDPIIRSLKVYESHGDSADPTMARGALRAIRRTCVEWLKNNESVKRSSKSVVEALVLMTSQRTDELVEAEVGRLSQYGANEPLGDSPTPVPKPAYLKDISGEEVSRVGNQLGQHLNKERAQRHWGPSTQMEITKAYTKYKQSGGRLTIGAFADHIYIPDMEDDPGGKYLGHSNVVSVQKIREGVKYCTPNERKRYSLSIANGVVRDYSGDPYDTSGRRTDFSRFGWAIFVLGFDNVLYSNTHLKDLFHHSSFFAGEPVQCGGEICCIGGRIRYLNCKTGHYKSGEKEFYRLLSFLNYHGVCLAGVLATSDCQLGYSAYYRANKVFSAGGGTPTIEKAPPNIPSRFGRAPTSSLGIQPIRTGIPPRGIGIPPKRVGTFGGDIEVLSRGLGRPDRPCERDPEVYGRPPLLNEPGVPVARLPGFPMAPSVELCRTCDFMCSRKMAA